MENKKQLAEQLKAMEEVKENLSNFVNTLTKQLPKEEQEKMEKLMNKVKLADIAPEVSEINKEIEKYLKNGI